MWKISSKRYNTFKKGINRLVPRKLNKKNKMEGFFRNFKAVRLKVSMICKKCTIESLNFKKKSVSNYSKRTFNKKFTMTKWYFNCKKDIMMISIKSGNSTPISWLMILRELKK